MSKTVKLAKAGMMALGFFSVFVGLGDFLGLYGQAVIAGGILISGAVFVEMYWGR